MDSVLRELRVHKEPKDCSCAAHYCDMCRVQCRQSLISRTYSQCSCNGLDARGDVHDAQFEIFLLMTAAGHLGQSSCCKVRSVSSQSVRTGHVSARVQVPPPYGSSQVTLHSCACMLRYTSKAQPRRAAAALLNSNVRARLPCAAQPSSQ